jgi:hypothetical protein
MKLARNKNYQTNQGCFQSGVVLPRVPNHKKTAGGLHSYLGPQPW